MNSPSAVHLETQASDADSAASHARLLRRHVDPQDGVRGRAGGWVAVFTPAVGTLPVTLETQAYAGQVYIRAAP